MDSTAVIKIKPPLIKPSRICAGGNGKALSECWVVNFAVGCTHGCRFCYVDSIHKRFNPYRLPGEFVQKRWGEYFAVPVNLDEAIRRTPWHRWAGQEVLMSSMHDPYLPQLYHPHRWPRRILEAGLRAKVRFRILTRSPLVLNDLDLLAQNRDSAMLMVSIATLDEALAKVLEPRVVEPRVRLKILEEAKAAGLRVGVVVAPIVPPNRLRPDLEGDLDELFKRLAEIGVDVVYGEMLHVRGPNMRYLAEAGLSDVKIDAKMDTAIEHIFTKLLKKYNLKGAYWKEYDQA